MTVAIVDLPRIQLQPTEGRSFIRHIEKAYGEPMGLHTECTFFVYYSGRPEYLGSGEVRVMIEDMVCHLDSWRLVWNGKGAAIPTCIGIKRAMAEADAWFQGKLNEGGSTACRVREECAADWISNHK